jgi:hypothetical protein
LQLLFFARFEKFLTLFLGLLLFYFVREKTMVFHVGIAPLSGEMALFNSANSRTKLSDFREVGKNNIDEIEGMYKRIKATAGKGVDLGNAGICIGKSYGNEIRQLFIKYGLECGFTKVEIIDWETTLYLKSISQTEYKPKNGDTICIINGNQCHFWHKSASKVQYQGVANGVFSEVASKGEKEPNIILFENDEATDEATVAAVFPTCQVFPYEQKSDAFGALIKAKLMAGDSEVEDFDFAPTLDRNLTVKVGDRKIMAFETRQSLPLKETILLKLDESEKILSIASGYFDDRITDDVILPVDKEFPLTVTIDTNGIISIHF